MRRFFLLFLILVLLLTGCNRVPPVDTTGNATDATDPTDSTTTTSTNPTANATNPTVKPTDPTQTTDPTKPTAPLSGWTQKDGKTYYLKEDGSYHTGWLSLDGKSYYLDAKGVLQTGWLELNGKSYYLKSDGSMARGKLVIDELTYYFTASGERIILVNPWNFVPSTYKPNLVNAENGYIVDSSCRDSLMQMLRDCRAAGYNAQICSAYRRHETQITLYNNKVFYYLDLGYNEADARQKAAMEVAVPGTSEHELGLAVDLVDNSYWVLDEAQEKTPAQKWLMAHCWEYGFILRYPSSKSAQTGIIYEPWHYRYVGKELAMELYKSGQCLEEYLNSLS